MKASARIIAIVLIIALIGLTGVMFPLVQERLVAIFDRTDSNRVERVLLWNGAWRMFLDHPVVGVGVGNFEETYLSSYISPEAKVRLGHAHNNFLHILAENGLLGFIGFTGMFGYMAWYLFRQYKAGNTLALGVLLALIALMIQGLTEFNFGNSAVIRMFWFLLGLAVANSRLVAKTHRRNNDAGLGICRAGCATYLAWI